MPFKICCLWHSRGDLKTTWTTTNLLRVQEMTWIWHEMFMKHSSSLGKNNYIYLAFLLVLVPWCFKFAFKYRGSANFDAKDPKFNLWYYSFQHPPVCSFIDVFVCLRDICYFVWQSLNINILSNIVPFYHTFVTPDPISSVSPHGISISCQVFHSLVNPNLKSC